MAEVLGPMQVVQQALPVGVDGTKITEWRLQDGTTMGAFIAQTGAALGAFNQDIARKWGFLFGLTEELFMEYPDGGSVSELAQITDIDKVDMVHGSTIGHMIDMAVYGGAVGGSRHYFRDARPAQILSTIRTIIRRAEWRFEKKLLNRFFSSAEVAIGSAGQNVPFVHSTGGSVDYTPPAYGGEAFASTHDHFIANNTGYGELLEAMAETLQEHGHVAPFQCLVSRADLASYRALGDFVDYMPGMVSMFDRGGASTGPAMFAQFQPDVAGGGLIGFFKTSYGVVELYTSQRIPTLYAGMFKSYGQLDQRNPLAVRVHPAEGFGAKIIPVPSHNEAYPVSRLDIEFEFGVGVGSDRTNGVVGKKAASYDADATIG